MLMTTKTMVMTEETIMAVLGLLVLGVIAYFGYRFYKWLRSIEASPYSPMHQLLGTGDPSMCCCYGSRQTGTNCCPEWDGRCPKTAQSCSGAGGSWVPKSSCGPMTRAKMPHYGLHQQHGYMPMY